MFPFLRIGSFQIPTYTVAYAAMIVVCGMYVFHRFFVEYNDPHRVLWGIAVSFLGGVSGAWVVHLIPVVWYWAQSGEWQPTTGSTFIGMLPGGALAVVLYSRWSGYAPWHILDRVAVVVPLGQAIIRVGCFSAGCCYGKPTDSWLGMYLRNIHGDWAVRYPTQLMYLVINLIIWQALRAYERYGQRRAGQTWGRAPDVPQMWPFDGFVALLYADLYWIKRFSTEFLRADGILTLGGVNWAYILSACGFVFTTALFVHRLYRTRPQRQPARVEES